MLAVAGGGSVQAGVVQSRSNDLLCGYEVSRTKRDKKVRSRKGAYFIYHEKKSEVLVS